MTKFNYFKTLNEKGKWISTGANFNYGFSDKKLRPTAYVSYKWNNITRPILRFSGGITTRQFNANNPISNIHNTFNSIFFENNVFRNIV